MSRKYDLIVHFKGFDKLFDNHELRPDNTTIETVINAVSEEYVDKINNNFTDTGEKPF